MRTQQTNKIKTLIEEKLLVQFFNNNKKRKRNSEILAIL